MELQEPGYVRTEYVDESPRPGLTRYVAVRLERIRQAGAADEHRAGPHIYGWGREEELDAEDLAALEAADTQSASPPGKPRFIRVGPLFPGHRYEVALGASLRDMGYDARILSQVVRVEPGKITYVPVKRPDGATVSGRVTDDRGNPLRFLNVRIKAGPNGELVLGAVTDKAGRYQIRGVPPGDHMLELVRYARRVGPG